MRSVLLADIVLTVSSGCATSTPRYRDESNLKSLVIGQTKTAALKTFGPRDVDRQGKSVKVAPLRMRAEQRAANGDLFEIGEVFLVDGTSGRVTPYWLLFKNGELAMWGRAADWARVKAGVPIHFEPSP